MRISDHLSNLLDRIEPKSDIGMHVFWWGGMLFWVLGIPTILGAIARAMGWQQGAGVEFTAFMVTFTTYIALVFAVCYEEYNG